MFDPRVNADRCADNASPARSIRNLWICHYRNDSNQLDVAYVYYGLDFEDDYNDVVAIWRSVFSALRTMRRNRLDWANLLRFRKHVQVLQ